jgi:uncharacterized protein YecE (DUF72 family)
VAVHVGTSGFAYRHWRGIFYPTELPAKQWLARFCAEFGTCELNTTFYRLPTADAVDGWRKGTPASFRFAVKGSRYLTHVKRLNEPAEALRRFFELVGRLRGKLGPVLWQLPPQMKPDLPRLEAFLRALPRSASHALEFRNGDWYTPEVADLLDRHGAAFCEHDLVRGEDGAGRAPPRLTGGWRYLRFHGATGKYQGRYGADGLAPFARSLARGPGAWAYFNNDLGGHALLDAHELGSQLRRLGVGGLLPRRAADDRPLSREEAAT